MEKNREEAVQIESVKELAEFLNQCEVGVVVSVVIETGEAQDE